MSKQYIAYSKAFKEVIGPNFTTYTVAETDAHEGPVYVRNTQELYFTTVPVSTDIPMTGFSQVAIKKVCLAHKNKVKTVREPSNMANGMTLDLKGRLIICEQGTKIKPARISRMNLRSGKVKTVVDQWSDLPFNSPNDVVVKSDGTIWFTDPSYGFHQGFKYENLIGNYVYRYDPKTRQTTVVADQFNRPNGLAFSPDESILYINDSGAIQATGADYDVNLPHHIKAFDVVNGRHLINERLFAVVSPGIPDGLKVDTEGRVYSSCFSGVKVYSPEGDLLGEILAEGVANFTFGGLENNILYLCVDTAILAAQLQAVGAADHNR